MYPVVKGKRQMQVPALIKSSARFRYNKADRGDLPSGYGHPDRCAYVAFAVGCRDVTGRYFSYRGGAASDLRRSWAARK